MPREFLISENTQTVLLEIKKQKSVLLGYIGTDNQSNILIEAHNWGKSMEVALGIRSLITLIAGESVPLTHITSADDFLSFHGEVCDFLERYEPNDK